MAAEAVQVNMDSPGIVNLDYVTKRVMLDLDYTDAHKYQKILQIAIDGLGELSKFVSQKVKVKYLTIDTNNLTVDLPSDFMKISKIGFERNGRINPINLNNNLILARDMDKCGTPQNVNEATCSADNVLLYPTYGYYFAPHFRNGRYVGELYGIGGGQSEIEYRLDEERRQLTLSNQFFTEGDNQNQIQVTEIILEYVSTGVEPGGSTVISRQAVRPLVKFIHWEITEYNKKASQAEKDRKMKQYMLAFEQYKEFEVGFTIDEYYDMVYSTYKQTPKR